MRCRYCSKTLPSKYTGPSKSSSMRRIFQAPPSRCQVSRCTTLVLILCGGRKRLSRVQVKSVSVRPANGIYHVATMRSVASNKKPYRAGDFDFLAAYIIPRGLWYIVPAREVFGIKMISLCPAPLGPRPRRRRLEKYRQAWRLLRG